MLTTAGKAIRSGQLRSLNVPRPVRVKTDRWGAPQAVVLGRQVRRVQRIRDRWRVDDTWWREPLCRMYFELEMADGQVLTLYQDQITGQWFQQWYELCLREHPARSANKRRALGVER